MTTRSLAGVLVPDTELVARAIEYAQFHSEPWLFNHVMRSWLFAESVAQQKKLEYDGDADLNLPEDVPMSHLRILGTALVLALVAQAPLPAHAEEHAIVTSLLQKDVPESPGKELLMISVEYPPGSVDPIHRHDAHAFVYVLEGTIIMQVRGGKEVTLTQGQTFYEGPNDVHTVGRNASKTKPAKFIVVLLKKKGADVLTPVE